MGRKAVVNEKGASLFHFFGDNPGPSKLWIKGYQNEIGSTVTFFYNNVSAQQTAQFKGAGANRVDLDFEVPVNSISGGSSGSGTGGGGGGVSSGESPENIELYETRDAELVAGVPVTYRFTTPQLAVYELVITANISAGPTSAKIEHLKGTSRLVTSPPPGAIYKNENIWLGSSGFAVPTNIREAIVRFRINNSWISGENIDANKISMMRRDGNQWVSLDTNQARKDDNFTYYEAQTNSFSPFAISGVKTALTEMQVTSTPGVKPTASPLALVPKTSISWILYVIVAIIIIAGVYYYMVKRN